MTDPMESKLAAILDGLGVSYVKNDAVSGLDFYLLNYDVYIEVKQFHSNRIAEQMSRRPNVIVIQGMESLNALERLLLLKEKK